MCARAGAGACARLPAHSHAARPPASPAHAEVSVAHPALLPAGGGGGGCGCHGARPAEVRAGAGDGGDARAAYSLRRRAARGCARAGAARGESAGDADGLPDARGEPRANLRRRSRCARGHRGARGGVPRARSAIARFPSENQRALRHAAHPPLLHIIVSVRSPAARARARRYRARRGRASGGLQACASNAADRCVPAPPMSPTRHVRRPLTAAADDSVHWLHACGVWGGHVAPIARARGPSRRIPRPPHCGHASAFAPRAPLHPPPKHARCAGRALTSPRPASHPHPPTHAQVRRAPASAAASLRPRARPPPLLTARTRRAGPRSSRR